MSDNFIAYDNPSNNVHIEYPLDWNYKENPDQAPDQQNVLVTFDSPDGKAHVRVNSIVYNVANIPPNPDVIAGNAIHNLKSSLTNFKLLENESGEVGVGDGLDQQHDEFAHPKGYRIVYTYHGANLGPVQQTEVFVTKNAPYIVFDLQFYAKQNDYSKYADTFSRMRDSLYVALV